jgi:hypothetical protein
MARAVDSHNRPAEREALVDKPVAVIISVDCHGPQTDRAVFDPEVISRATGNEGATILRTLRTLVEDVSKVSFTIT